MRGRFNYDKKKITTEQTNERNDEYTTKSKDPLTQNKYNPTHVQRKATHFSMSVPVNLNQRESSLFLFLQRY